MMRLLEWRSRLLTWGLALQGKPFRWGETDCATLGRASLAQCFGRDVVPHVGKPWKTVRQAAARLRKFPYEQQLEGAGAQLVELAYVRAGDVLVAPESDALGISVMVCLDGSHFLASSTEDGVRIVGRENVPEDTAVYSLWEAPDNG